MKNQEILKVKDLLVAYTDEKSSLFRTKAGSNVLKGVSFHLDKGEIVGLVGESGSGKSTLAKAVLGLIPSYEGEIWHATGRPQMVFQDPYSSLNPAKKVGWLLEEPLKLMGKMTKEERRSEVSAMLLRVGLEEKIADRYPGQLSGGQRQRVCIAQALMCRPGLMVADEPVSALDVTVQKQILELFQKIQREMELSILFISHDMRVVYQLCSRVIILKDGVIVENGEVDEVFFNPQHPYTRTLLKAAGIGEDADAALQPY